jgi:hypothetical protein
MAGVLKRRLPLRVNALTTALMLRSMMHRARTVTQLAEDSGLNLHTVRRYIKALHMHRVIHIAMRVPDVRGRMIIKAYMLGDAPDAQPCPKTDRQNEVAYQERKRKRAEQQKPKRGRPTKDTQCAPY